MAHSYQNQPSSQAQEVASRIRPQLDRGTTSGLGPSQRCIEQGEKAAEGKGVQEHEEDCRSCNNRAHLRAGLEGSGGDAGHFAVSKTRTPGVHMEGQAGTLPRRTVHEGIHSLSLDGSHYKDGD